SRQLVLATLDLIPDGRCDFIFLVGGFAQSAFLREGLLKGVQEWYSTRQHGSSLRLPEFIVPDEPGASVLWGAVKYGLDPSQIRVRRARFTIGCAIAAPFEDGVDPPEREVMDHVTNSRMCRQRFEVLVRAGESIHSEKRVRRCLSPLSVGAA